ncbi:hypothetical protein [Nocardiopsis algeriensis]|uniref:Uncharacterized protein n=1 Tax=Nocardiopsis algeriensis TaxID=1478215 RepID=A0A841IN58_9ACTN|nr:hypothetical protein [Nocardiopsis algeriensis]MBB6120177.1 hypothetical protein [Nocardiopsis algeriensis]
MPEYGFRHQEQHFVEELTFTGTAAILTVPRELCPHGVDGRLSAWNRDPACRPALLPGRSRS